MIDSTMLDFGVLFWITMVLGVGIVLGVMFQKCMESNRKLKQLEGEERLRQVLLSEGAD